MGRGNYSPKAKHVLVLKLRELGYMVEQQQETIQMLSGTVIAMAEEIDALIDRVKIVEARQPATFA